MAVIMRLVCLKCRRFFREKMKNIAACIQVRRKNMETAFDINCAILTKIKGQHVQNIKKNNRD